MGTFNAATAVESLDFDFTAFDGPKNTIPEPTTGQVEVFFRTFRDMYRTINPDITDQEAVEALKGMSEEEGKEMGTRLKQAIVDLCSDSLSIADLDRLPYRVFSAFAGWLAGSLRPEASTSATSR